MNASRVFAAASLADLAGVLALVDEACAGADADAAFAVRLAAEEVFANILEHGYGGRAGPVAVAIERGDRALRLVLQDEAAMFDPACAPAPAAPDTPLEDREPGGLGWHLVHQLMDEVTHAPRSPRGNTYTLVKRLPAPVPATRRGIAMHIRIHPRDSVAVVAIAGSVDGLTAETLLATLQGHVEDGHTRLVVDLAGVEYTSSAGLRALLATVKEARRRGGDLRLAQINPNVRKVLELSGFATILKIYAEVDEAVDSYA